MGKMAVTNVFQNGGCHTLVGRLKNATFKPFYRGCPGFEAPQRVEKCQNPMWCTQPTQPTNHTEMEKYSLQACPMFYSCPVHWDSLPLALMALTSKSWLARPSTPIWVIDRPVPGKFSSWRPVSCLAPIQAAKKDQCIIIRHLSSITPFRFPRREQVHYLQHSPGEHTISKTKTVLSLNGIRLGTFQVLLFFFIPLMVYLPFQSRLTFNTSDVASQA